MKFLKSGLVIVGLLGLAANTCDAIWPFSPKAITETLANQDLENLRGAITPANSAFVFDMHGVVVKFSLSEAWAAVRKMSFANKIHFAKKTYKYFRNNPEPKRAFEGVALEGKENDKEYVDQAIAVMNPHVPNDEIVAVLKELSDLGYEIFGCSNIGNKSYAYLKNKYPEAFASIITCRTSHLDNNYMKKSDAKVYQETLEMIARSQSSNRSYEHLIFVDDKQSNLTLARQTNKSFVQLLLKDPKKLRPNLVNLGIVAHENQ